MQEAERGVEYFHELWDPRSSLLFQLAFHNPHINNFFCIFCAQIKFLLHAKFYLQQSFAFRATKNIRNPFVSCSAESAGFYHIEPFLLVQPKIQHIWVWRSHFFLSDDEVSLSALILSFVFYTCVFGKINFCFVSYWVLKHMLVQELHGRQ